LQGLRAGILAAGIIGKLLSARSVGVDGPNIIGPIAGIDGTCVAGERNDNGCRRRGWLGVLATSTAARTQEDQAGDTH